jgi:uncharacterized membrane protein YdjX (TVP38/TMEM64 family)
MSDPLDPAIAPTRPGLPRLLGRLLRSSGLRVLLLLCLMGWLLQRGLAAFGGPEAVRARFGLGAGLLLIPIHAVVAATPFPGDVLALGYGAIYGFALGWPFAWAGWMLGAALEYAVFRRIASDVGVDARLPAWLRRFPAQHPLFLILGRLVPFGNHAVNALAGTRRVPLWRFAWASALGLLPSAALSAAIGSGLVR